MRTANFGQQTANFGQTVPPCFDFTVPLCKNGLGGTVCVKEIVVFWLFFGFYPRQKKQKNPSNSLNLKGLSLFWRLLS